MLLALQNTIQHLLYQRGQISPHEVDITFEAPTRDRIERLMRPTISVFLYDVQENTDLRQSDFERTRKDGRAERRMPPRRFDLHYMVSILTTEIEDEQLLFWRVLLTLVQHPHFPVELLSEELRGAVPALTTRVGQADEGQGLPALWSALGTSPRAALAYTVTVPVDMNFVIEAPLVLTRTARYTRLHDSKSLPETRYQIGGVVRGADGLSLADVNVAIEGRATDGCTTDNEGRFILCGVPSGTVTLRLTRADGTWKLVTVEVEPGQVEKTSSTPIVQRPYDIVLEATPTP